MAFLKSSELLTFKLENGTIPSPDILTTDVNIRLRDMDWSNENERDNESSEFMTGTWFGSDESIVGKKKASASYSMKIAPGQFTPETDPGVSGDAVHVLTYKDLFGNCGLNVTEAGTAATDNAEGTYTFYPDQALSQNTMSIARILYDGESDTYQASTAAGAMSNFSISADGTSKPFQVSFDTMGRAENVVTIDDGTQPILDEANIMHTVADSMKNTTVKITDLSDSTSVEFCITNMNLESGNELNEIECQASDSGLLKYAITKINPNIVIDPLLRTLADFDWWDAVTSEKFYMIEIVSEYVSILVPRAQINGNAVGESNGSMRNELTFRPLINIDGVFPDGVGKVDTTVITEPANITTIPYFVTIKERQAQY